MDLCPRGRAFVKSAFYWLAKIVRRGRGRWRVVSATTRRGFGRAKVRISGWPTPPTVRFPPSTGRTVKVVIDPGGVRFLGHRAEVTPSPAC